MTKLSERRDPEATSSEHSLDSNAEESREVEVMDVEDEQPVLKPEDGEGEVSEVDVESDAGKTTEESSEVNNKSFDDEHDQNSSTSRSKKLTKNGAFGSQGSGKDGDIEDTDMTASPKKAKKTVTSKKVKIENAPKPRSRTDSPDVTIRLTGGGKIILTHEAVVAEASSYYKQKLSTQKSRKSVTKEINVTCSDRDKLNEMIKLLYEDAFIVATALEYVEFAQKTQFDLFSAKLAAVLADNVTDSNCVNIKMKALDLKDEKLNMAADDYFRDNFDKVLKSKDFLKLPLEKFQLLLIPANLQISEKRAKKMAETWLDYEGRRRNQNNYVTVSAMRLLRSKNYKEDSIINNMGELKLDSEQTAAAPGWAFLVDIITPGRLTKALTKLPEVLEKKAIQAEKNVQAFKQKMKQEESSGKRKSRELQDEKFVANGVPMKFKIPKIEKPDDAGISNPFNNPSDKARKTSPMDTGTTFSTEGTHVSGSNRRVNSGHVPTPAHGHASSAHGHSSGHGHGQGILTTPRCRDLTCRNPLCYYPSGCANPACPEPTCYTLPPPVVSHHGASHVPLPHVGHVPAASTNTKVDDWETTSNNSNSSSRNRQPDFSNGPRGNGRNDFGDSGRGRNNNRNDSSGQDNTDGWMQGNDNSGRNSYNSRGGGGDGGRGGWNRNNDNNKNFDDWGQGNKNQNGGGNDDWGEGGQTTQNQERTTYGGGRGRGRGSWNNDGGGGGNSNFSNEGRTTYGGGRGGRGGGRGGRDGGFGGGRGGGRGGGFGGRGRGRNNDGNDSWNSNGSQSNSTNNTTDDLDWGTSATTTTTAPPASDDWGTTTSAAPAPPKASQNDWETPTTASTPSAPSTINNDGWETTTTAPASAPINDNPDSFGTPSASTPAAPKTAPTTSLLKPTYYLAATTGQSDKDGWEGNSGSTSSGLTSPAIMPMETSKDEAGSTPMETSQSFNDAQGGFQDHSNPLILDASNTSAPVSQEAPMEMAPLPDPRIRASPSQQAVAPPSMPQVQNNPPKPFAPPIVPQMQNNAPKPLEDDEWS